MVEWRCNPTICDLGNNGGEWSASRLGSFIAQEIAPATHWTEGSVAPRAGPDSNTSLPFWELNPGRPASSPALKTCISQN
jgi:hypothetical protein